MLIGCCFAMILRFRYCRVTPALQLYAAEDAITYAGAVDVDYAAEAAVMPPC